MVVYISLFTPKYLKSAGVGIIYINSYSKIIKKSAIEEVNKASGQLIFQLSLYF